MHVSSPSLGIGTLVVTRDKGQRDGLRDYIIRVDGKRLARVAEGGHASVPLTAGVHVVQLTLDWAKSRETTVTIVEDETTTIFCRPTSGRVLAPILKAKDYVAIQSSEWVDDLDVDFHWAKRYLLSYVGAFVLAVVLFVILDVAGASPTVAGVVLAVCLTTWIVMCVLTDGPIRWLRRRQ
jgi:hypothetical protein